MMIELQANFGAPRFTFMRQDGCVILTSDDGEGTQSLKQPDSSRAGEVIVADTRVSQLEVTWSCAERVTILRCQVGEPLDRTSMFGRCNAEIAMPSLPSDLQDTGANQ